MTNRYELTKYGVARAGNTTAFSLNCEDGEYITEFNVKAGRQMDSLDAKCSDGKWLGRVGGGGGSASNVSGGPWSYIPIRYDDWWIKNVLSAGAGLDDFNNRFGDVAYCPEGTVVVGYRGETASENSGTYIGKLGINCGVNKNTFCIDNLENDMCKKAPKELLNKACAKNMTATCRNRRTELDESLVLDFCRYNISDPLCGCLLPVPDYLAGKGVDGMPQCWNQACATSGYLLGNLNKPCPDITICNQNIGTSGDSNVLTKNINTQDCSSKSTVAAIETQAPASQTKTPTQAQNTTQTPAGSALVLSETSTNKPSSNTTTKANETILASKTQTQNEDPESESSIPWWYWLIFLAVILLIVIGLYFALRKKSPNQTTTQDQQQQIQALPPQQYQPPQQYPPQQYPPQQYSPQQMQALPPPQYQQQQYPQQQMQSLPPVSPFQTQYQQQIEGQ